MFYVNVFKFFESNLSLRHKANVNKFPYTHRTLANARIFVHRFQWFHQILLTSQKCYIPELCLCTKWAVPSVKDRGRIFTCNTSLSTPLFICLSTHESIKSTAGKCLEVCRNPVGDCLELHCLINSWF